MVFPSYCSLSRNSISCVCFLKQVIDWPPSPSSPSRSDRPRGPVLPSPPSRPLRSLSPASPTRPLRQHALRTLRRHELHRSPHAVHLHPQHLRHARLRQRVLRLLLAQLQQLAHTCECRFRDELAQHADVLRIISLHHAHVLDHAFPQQLSPQRRLSAVLHVATHETTQSLPREQGVSFHRLERWHGPSQQLGVLKAGEEAPTR